MLSLAYCSVKHTLPVLLPLLSCNDARSDLLWFLREYISFGQANVEGYTTEVIFQSFKTSVIQKTFDDHYLLCFYTKRGIWGVYFYLHVVNFVHWYTGYMVFFYAELCTTSWAPVLTNKQFKECMFTYM